MILWVIAVAFLLVVGLVNGRAVSPDQFVVRALLVFGVSFFGICRLVGLRRTVQVEDSPNGESDASALLNSGTLSESRVRRIVLSLLAIHALLVGWCAYRNSFSWTETGLLAAGILDWQYGSFDVFRVNPPLVRMIAALPSVAMGTEVPFRGVSVDQRNRAEWDVARSMIETNREAIYLNLMLGRWLCIPFSLLGAWIAWKWATELYGVASGIGVVILWTFSPIMIGYSCLISGDAQAASMGLLTLYVFRQWLRSPGWSTSYVFGVVSGITILTKTSWMILLGLLPILWISVRCTEALVSTNRGSGTVEASIWGRAKSLCRQLVRELGLAICSVGLCFLVINLAYGFDNSFRSLGSFEFISKALAGEDGWRSHDFHGNRFAGRWLGAIPVPLPEDLIIGMDLQKWDFDRERWSYLRGEWRTQGWWYYYLYALAIKTPLGTLILLITAIFGSVFRRSWRGSWQDFVILAVPVFVVLSAASLETGLNRHVRYVLPIVPLVFVLISRVFRSIEGSNSILRSIVWSAAIWMIFSSLWIYPHSHSYFNETIGGPLQGSAHLNASNLDWGQDLRFVSQWSRKYPDRQPLWVQSYLHLVRPEQIGIPNSGRVPSMHRNRGGIDASQTVDRFQPGWYLIDNESILREQGDYRYLQSLPTVDFIGYGFRAYEITPSLANELNRQFNNQSTPEPNY